MFRAFTLLAVYFVVIFFYGCAGQEIYLDRAIIRNETRGVISEVRVRHEPTGKIGEVHSILPHSTFELGFSPGPLLAKRSTITWQNQNGQINSAELSLPQYQKRNQTGQTMLLIYTIHPDGNVTVELKNRE